MKQALLSFIAVLFVSLTSTEIIESAEPGQTVEVREDLQARDDAKRLETLFSRIDNSTSAAFAIGKNHRQVKAAFRDSVASAKRATVIVQVDGQQVAMGTIADKNGYVLTKASQLSDGELTCFLAGREQVAAKVVGVVAKHDLAMLKIARKNLPAVSWKSLALPSVGSWIATTSLGKDPLAVGIVSVGSRRIRRESGVLGIEMDESHAKPRVVRIMTGSGADDAGIMPDDIILTVNGKGIETRYGLISTMKTYRPGDEVKVTVRREAEQIELFVTLGRFADFDPNVIEFQNFVGGELSTRRSGFPAVIQHDTVLLPNQCGGPVVDIDGRLVGINIARADRTASYLIPAISVRALVDDLKAGKYSPQIRLTSKD